jgi:tetratricopeptide (TPR) repeat protein
MGSVPDSAKKFVESLDNLLRANREFFEQFKATLHSDPQALQSFIESLVELLHNSGQRIVNLYLEGDVAELERRSYYYSRSGYDAYINMYKLALQLVPADLPLARILKLNLNYFSGLVTRLKITTATESEQKKLIEIALGFQNLATAMEPEAAFVHNELGILFWSKKDFTSAKKHFIRATELAPDWALPWANLSGLYGYTKEFDKGIAAGQAADSLKADLHTSAIQQGYLYEQKGNLLFAEEYYRKAIDINSRHYFPFERLGYVYMNTTNYAAADSFFHEADLRKRGYHFQGNSFILNVVAAPGFEIGFPQCQFNPDLIKKDDIVGLFYWGIVNFRGQNYKMAEQVTRTTRWYFTTWVSFFIASKDGKKQRLCSALH